MLQPYQAGPYLITELPGHGLPDDWDEVVQELIQGSAACLVFRLPRGWSPTPESARRLGDCVRAGMRVGKHTCLVNCTEVAYRLLREEQLPDGVAHTATVMAATQGRVGNDGECMELNLRGDPQSLERVSRMVELICRRFGFPADRVAAIQAAVVSAVTNAVQHGSPEGSRNSLDVKLHALLDCMVVEVSDQGPGFDRQLLHRGSGWATIEAASDQIDCFQDPTGMLVRLTFAGSRVSEEENAE